MQILSILDMVKAPILGGHYFFSSMTETLLYGRKLQYIEKKHTIERLIKEPPVNIGGICEHFYKNPEKSMRKIRLSPRGI